MEVLSIYTTGAPAGLTYSSSVDIDIAYDVASVTSTISLPALTDPDSSDVYIDRKLDFATDASGFSESVSFDNGSGGSVESSYKGNGNASSTVEQNAVDLSTTTHSINQATMID